MNWEIDIPSRNPVVDWGRSAKAGFQYAGHKLGSPPVEGGSTLATQSKNSATPMEEGPIPARRQAPADGEREPSRLSLRTRHDSREA